MAERSYLSIGDVLGLLKEEFPDVTISKIRFLESQGLLDPERTPSGYRKFYQPDVERLRWILHQQRDYFLPLKVIRGRLAAGDKPANGSAAIVDPEAGAPEAEDPPPPDPAAPGGGAPAAGGGMGTGGGQGLGQAARAAAGEEGEDSPLMAGPSASSMTADELARSSGLTTTQLEELEHYGLIAGRAVAGTVYYDEEAFTVAALAAAFARYGIEARHLRMYKTTTDREAGFFEQIITPLRKQRHPESRRRAVDDLAELTRLGQRLRASLLRVALRDHTGG